MGKNNKVLVIGLDGATWDVLDPWISNGTLPNLSKLRATGCWGKLNSTIPPLTSPAWTSFMTGKNPGKHGILHFIDQEDLLQSAESNPRIVNNSNIKSSTLWDILGHHDRKVGLINLPVTYPPRAVNGFLITGFLTPPGASIFTYPPSLSRELADYRIDLDQFISRKPFESLADKATIDANVKFVQDLYDLMVERAKTSLSLMNSETWDVFMCVFMGTDRLGHYMWPFHRSVDLDGSEESLEIHKAIHEYYIRLDGFVGEFVEQAGEDTTIIVVSDHGMGAFPSKYVHFNYWLKQRKLVSSRGFNLFNIDNWVTRLGLSRDRLGSIILGTPILNKTKLVKRLRKTKAPSTDVEESIAYYKSIYGQTGFIYINYPKDSSQYEELRRKLMSEIMEITDPETGKSVVQQVFKGEDCYSGSYIIDIPAIVLVLNPEYGGTDRLSSYSSLVTKRTQTTNPGDHKMEGIFMMSGPLIQRIDEALSEINIIDIAPTILHILGLPVPSDMDGQVISKPFVRGSSIDCPISQSAPIGIWNGPEEHQQDDWETNIEDDSRIRERLSALGYLD